MDIQEDASKHGDGKGYRKRMPQNDLVHLPNLKNKIIISELVSHGSLFPCDKMS
jgi:hypothetical protein